MKHSYVILLPVLMVFCSLRLKAQTSPNPIITAVPFLTISPDARSGGLGDGGVAISSDANATFWNPSRMVLIPQTTNIALSYSPWFRQTIPGSYLAYGSVVQSIDDRYSIGVSIRNLKLGNIALYDQNENSLGKYQPSEYAIDFSVARKFGDHFALGLTVRYINSDLSNSIVVQGVQSKPISTIASDVSLSYDYPYQDGSFSFGLNISNIGPKVSYYSAGTKYFLPTNLRMGPAWAWGSDQLKWQFTFDINKLLVPTPPLRDANGIIVQGTDDNRSVVSGIFGSFSDAPGGGSEELNEVYGSTGLEVVIAKRVALRGGYFYENEAKGNRQYATVGCGLSLDAFDINFSYIKAQQTESPLANALRFSLVLHFGERNNEVKYGK